MAEKTVICPSCGAHFAATEPRCPYCGTMYVPAAEREYMEKLDDVREDLEDVGDAGDAAGREAARHTGRHLLRLVILTAAFLAVLGGLFAWKASREKADTRAEYRWQREHFPEMDELLASGQYEELLEVYEAAQEADHDMWQWEHDDFCQIYRTIVYTRETLAFVESEPSEKEHYQEDLLYGLMVMRGMTYRRELLREDEERLTGLAGELPEEVAACLEISEEDWETFDASLKKNGGYPAWDDIKAFFR